MPGAKTAGLALSVGHAGIATRIFLAAIVLVTSAIVAAAAVMIGRSVPAVSIVLMLPLAIVGLIAALFIAAPHSRFGVWVDRSVPRLGDRNTAVATYGALVSVSAAIQWSVL